MIELKSRNYLVKVKSSVEKGEEALAFGDKVLVFKEPTWRGVIVNIEKKAWDTFRSYARKRRKSLRKLLLEIVHDPSIPVFPLSLREIRKQEHKKGKVRSVKKGITLNKDDIERINQIKGDHSLHRFLVGKIYGWYFTYPELDKNPELDKRGLEKYNRD